MNSTELNTKQTINTSVCKLELKSDNIIFVHTLEDSNIEIPEIDEIHDALDKLVGDKPCYLVVIAATGSNSSNEAREYGARLKGKRIIAEAIVINNIATRLLANFYMKMNRPTQKIKLFKDESSAHEWIVSLINETK